VNAYDFGGRVALVTGGASGIGAATVACLRGHGATVASLDLKADAEGADLAVSCDVTDAASVDAAVAAVLARFGRLDVLVNNAGIGSTVPSHDRAESCDAIELRFAVNYLSHYLLTRTLLPLLKASPPSRIVNVASAGQAPIDFADPMITRGYSGARAYCQSKLAQILFTFDLAEELSGTGVTASALHPATFMPTKIVPSPISTLDEGVQATLRLITDPALAGITSKYFNGTHEATAEAQAYDPAERAKLRALSDELAAR